MKKSMTEHELHQVFFRGDIESLVGLEKCGEKVNLVAYIETHKGSDEDPELVTSNWEITEEFLKSHNWRSFWEKSSEFGKQYFEPFNCPDAPVEEFLDYMKQRYEKCVCYMTDEMSLEKALSLPEKPEKPTGYICYFEPALYKLQKRKNIEALNYDNNTVKYAYEVDAEFGAAAGSIYIPKGATDEEIMLRILENLCQVKYWRSE